MADLVDMSQRLRDTATLHGWTGWPPANSIPAIMLEAATEIEALRKRCEAVEADAARWRNYMLFRNNSDGHSHKCRKCGHGYTPLRTESEDCPVCGHDGKAIAAAQEPSHGVL